MTYPCHKKKLNKYNMDAVGWKKNVYELVAVQYFVQFWILCNLQYAVYI